MRDPLRLAPQVVLIPPHFVPVLSLIDGTRDAKAIQTGYTLRANIEVPLSQIEALLQGLDESLMLENDRYAAALADAMAQYRAAPFRPAALAGSVYPDEPDVLRSIIGRFHAEAASGAPATTVEGIVGVVSPHIDYERGWRTYAATWSAAKQAAQEADLIVILGTDHAGGLGSVTLTRQNYSTPLGILPTDVTVVDQLASILGEENAYAEESHHIGEHSIELATIWLHHAVDGASKTILPILCGPHEPLLNNDSEEAARVWAAFDALAEIASQRRVLVVAAGDMSHMGPVFGDATPIVGKDRERVQASDEAWLAAAGSGTSETLTAHILQNGDATRICGAAPIHYLARILPGATGKLHAYDICPADEQDESFVSIAGVLYTV